MSSPFDGISEYIEEKKKPVEVEDKQKIKIEKEQLKLQKEQLKVQKEQEKKNKKIDLCLEGLQEADELKNLKPLKKARKRKVRPEIEQEGEPEGEEDTYKKKSTLLNNIRKYQSNKVLGPYLKKSIDFKGIDKYNEERLLLKIDEIEEALENRTNESLIDGSFKKGMHMLEAFTHFNTRYKVLGTTEEVWKKEHWLFLWERVKFKYGLNATATRMDPVLEMGLITAQTAWHMHQKNLLDEPPLTNLDVSIPLSACQ